jgi:hypothetical protein
MVRARRRSRQSLPRSSICLSWPRSSSVSVSVLALRDMARLSGGGGGKYTRISRRTYPEALSGLGSSSEIVLARIRKESRNAWIDFFELSYFSICSLAADSASAAIACSVNLSKSKAPAVAIFAATGTDRFIRLMPMVLAFSKYSFTFDSSPDLDNTDKAEPISPIRLISASSEKSFSQALKYIVGTWLFFRCCSHILRNVVFPCLQGASMHTTIGSTVDSTN